MIKEAWHGEKKINTKDCHADLVTETDQNVETFIISSFKEKFPSHKYSLSFRVDTSQSGNQAFWSPPQRKITLLILRSDVIVTLKSLKKPEKFSHLNEVLILDW